MKRAVLGIGCVLALLPGVASAALVSKVQDKVLPLGASGVQFVDIVFEATGANQSADEALAFYDLGLRLVKRGGTLGNITFVTPFAEKLPNAEGFIFPDAAEFVVAESSPTAILANVSANTSANFDITSGKKAGRVYFTVDPLTSLDSVYEIQLDPDLTIFAAGAGDDPIIPVTLASGQITFIPEPGTLSLLAIGGLMALRRRRTA
jgi:hypothetical protein